MSGRTWTIFACALTLTLLIAFLAAIAISRTYWGYALAPPKLDRRIATARQVISLTPVSTVEDPEGTRTFSVDPAYAIVKCGDTSPGGYYELELRAVRALQAAGRLPGPTELLADQPEEDKKTPFGAHKWQLSGPVPRIGEEQLAELYALVESTGLLSRGTPGYESATMLSGIVVEMEGTDGERLLLVAVAGEQASNDHYPYYEFLFFMPEDGGEPRLLSCNRWFYDNAGIEGMTWSVLFLVFLVPAVVLAIIITALVHAARRSIRVA